MPVWETFKVGRTRRDKPVYGLVPSTASFTNVYPEEDNFFYIDVAGFYINTSQLLAYDGTSSAPGLAFVQDTNTGLKRDPDGSMTFLIDGNTALDIGPASSYLITASNLFVTNDATVNNTVTAGGAILANGGVDIATTFNLNLATGSQSLGSTAHASTFPTYSFTGDSDTGMYWDTFGVAFSVDGNKELHVKRGVVRVSGGFYTTFGEPVYRLREGSGIILTSLPNSPNGYQIDATGNFYGPIKITDGSLTNPAIQFISDPDTGVYKTAGGIGFSVGGISRFTIDTDSIDTVGALNVYDSSDVGSTIAGNITFAEGFATNTITIGDVTDGSTHIENNDGTAGAPSYSFRNDDDTGVFRIADNKLGISAGGGKQVTVTRQAVTVAGGFYSATFGEPAYNIVAGDSSIIVTQTSSSPKTYTIASTVGFYSLTVGEDDNPLYRNINVIKFDGANFYVHSNTNSDVTDVHLRNVILRDGTVAMTGSFTLDSANGTGIRTSTNTTVGAVHPGSIVTSTPGFSFKQDTTTGMAISAAQVTASRKGLLFVVSGKSRAVVYNDKFLVQGGFYSQAFGETGYKKTFLVTNPSREWQITHSYGHNNIVFNTYDTKGKWIIPANSFLNDPNIAYFYFTANRSGKVVMVG